MVGSTIFHFWEETTLESSEAEEQTLLSEGLKTSVQLQLMTAYTNKVSYKQASAYVNHLDNEVVDNDQKGIDPLEWKDDVLCWLNSLKAAGMSKQTIATRRRQIVATAHGLNLMPRDVTGEDIVSWCGKQRWKPETRKGYRNAIHGFFSWMTATGRRETDPSLELPKIQRPKAHPHPCPDAVIICALAIADDAEKLMILLGSQCGLRRSEIARVSSRDVLSDIPGKSLIVRGKGDKQRLVPLPDDLAKAIEHAEGFLFKGRWSGHVESSYIGRHVGALLGNGWSTHSLRHRYATTVYLATHNLLLVSQLLGHESVETTQRYVALPDSRLRSVLKAVALDGKATGCNAVE